MNEDYSIRISKKIRNQLIYYSYLELKKKSKRKNCLLINSMTYSELCDKYQKYSDYCVKKTEEYSSSLMNNGINNYDYFHISVTYCPLNKNYNIYVDRNVDKFSGKNNIVGKYFIGNSIQIRATPEKFKYNEILNEKTLEKKVIGQKKFIKHNRSVFSSLNVNNNIGIIDKVNINEANEIDGHLNNLNSNCNQEYYKKIIAQNINNEKIQTNCVNKLRKTNTQRIQNKYMSKLKSYCANLILLKRKVNRKNTLEPNKNKIEEPISPTNKRKYKERNHYFKSGKDKPKMEDPPILHSNVDFNLKQNPNLISKISSENKNLYSIHGKLKSQTKMKIYFRKNRTKSVDKNEEKVISPKKSSLKKAIVHDLNSGPGIGTSRFFHVLTKKERNNEDMNNKKISSGNKIDINMNKKKQNQINSSINARPTNNVNNNEKPNSNFFRANNITKKGKLKKSLTINKMYKFRAGEVLEKKISGIKFKDSNF